MNNSLSIKAKNDKAPVWPIWAYAMGLMVMPDNFAMAGKFAGQFGVFAPLILAAGVLIYFSYARSYTDLYLFSHKADDKNNNGRTYLGTWLAYYPMVIRVVTAILLATGLTVSSGYVFNEVFVYWFPNFAFAFIILGALVGLQLLGKSHRQKAQILFVGMVLLGMAILIAIGMITGLFQDSTQVQVEQLTGMSGLFLPLLLWLGFDMAISPNGGSSNRYSATAITLKSAIAVFAGFVIFWVITALLHVDGQRLATTSIAHMIAAREIAGQTGRIIMGVMIIAGTCAAVNALFESVARQTANFSRQRMLPRNQFLPKVVVLGMASVAALLMAGGLAGEELLETLIRAALLMWLGNYGLIAIRLMIRNRQLGGSPKGRVHGQSRLQLTISAAITFAAVSVLTLTDDQPMLMLSVMILSIGAVLIFGGIYKIGMNRHG